MVRGDDGADDGHRVPLAITESWEADNAALISPLQEMMSDMAQGGGWSFAKLTIVNATLREWAGKSSRTPTIAANGLQQRICHGQHLPKPCGPGFPLAISGAWAHLGHRSILMFIQTEDTPNPDVIKFIPGREVLAIGTTGSSSPTRCDDAKASPLAEAMFAIEGASAP